jgi:hypothetical protein
MNENSGCSAETGNSGLAQDCVVADAVCCEPVSVAKFPDNWENTGNFVDSALFRAFLIRISPRKPKACSWIPYASEQGIIPTPTGNLVLTTGIVPGP